MIRLNVFIQVSAENRAAVLESAKELVAYSLKDNGCIAYDVFESATRSDVLMICETWKDAESLSAHEKADHFVALVPKIQGLAAMKLEKLRHTFTTRMCEAGVNIKVIQDALGHSDISTALNIYADVTKEMKAEEFKGLDSYFKV